jgi:type IV pilus assembly protein PilW
MSVKIRALIGHGSAHCEAGHWQTGLSMIELMVAMAVGLVLSVGLFTMIANTSQSFKIQDDFARVQDNAATALRYLGDSIHQAGFYGNLMTPGNLRPITASAVATVNDCGSAGNAPAANWALDFTTPLIAYPNLTPTNINGIFPCIRAQNFSAGPAIANTNRNPVLVTRGANGYRICAAIFAAPGPPNCTTGINLLTAQNNYTTTIYVQGDPYSGVIFYGADYAAMRPTVDAKKYPNGNDFEMFEYRTHDYYVRPCSRPAGGAANCTGAADDNNQPIPTLVRQQLVGSTMTEVPLVEGIELVDYRFGVDTNSDGVPEFFTPTPVATDWINVVAVKVSLLVRSNTMNAGYDDSAKRYDLDGDGTIDYRCDLLAAPACSFKRKVFSQIFQVRNVAQRRLL